MALVVVLAYGVTWAGLDFDFVAALNSLAVKAVAFPTLLLGAAKAVAEAMNVIGEEDPMEFHTMSRSAELGGFWRRVL